MKRVAPDILFVRGYRRRILWHWWRRRYAEGIPESWY